MTGLAGLARAVLATMLAAGLGMAALPVAEARYTPAVSCEVADFSMTLRLYMPLSRDRTGSPGEAGMKGSLEIHHQKVPKERRVWSLDGRAYWNRRGARLPIAGTSGYQDVSADYISIPLLLKAARPGTVRPYALGGAELGVRIRARVRTVVGAVDAEEDAQDLIRRTDVSLAGGAGIERALGKSTVFVEGLYSHGLRNVTPDASGDTTRTRTVTLLAGLRF